VSALPVAAEVNRWPALHRQTDNTVRLLAVADAAEVLPPGCLLGIAKEIRPGDMVVMPELATAQAGEIGLRRIGAGTADAHMGDLASTAFSSWCHRYLLQLPIQIRGLSLLHDPRPFPRTCPTHIRSPCITTIAPLTDL